MNRIHSQCSGAPPDASFTSATRGLASAKSWMLRAHSFHIHAKWRGSPPRVLVHSFARPDMVGHGSKSVSGERSTDDGNGGERERGEEGFTCFLY